jgi:putative ABC transport system ATP-binding protein
VGCPYPCEAAARSSAQLAIPCRPPGGQRQRVAIARALAQRAAPGPRRRADRQPRQSAATTEILRLFEPLRANGQTLVIVTHDTRIAATADRLLAMRDGELVDDTRLTGGIAGSLSTMVGLDG